MTNVLDKPTRSWGIKFFGAPFLLAFGSRELGFVEIPLSSFGFWKSVIQMVAISNVMMMMKIQMIKDFVYDKDNFTSVYLEVIP